MAIIPIRSVGSLHDNHVINFRGVKKEAISEGVGVAFRGLFPGAPSKVGELCKTNSCSIC